MQVLGNVNEDLTSEVSISHKHTLWTVNDFKGMTPWSFQLLWGHFTWKDPSKAVN